MQPRTFEVHDQPNSEFLSHHLAGAHDRLFVKHGSAQFLLIEPPQQNVRHAMHGTSFSPRPCALRGRLHVAKRISKVEKVEEDNRERRSHQTSMQVKR